MKEIYTSVYSATIKKYDFQDLPESRLTPHVTVERRQHLESLGVIVQTQAHAPDGLKRCGFPVLRVNILIPVAQKLFDIRREVPAVFVA